MIARVVARFALLVVSIAFVGHFHVAMVGGPFVADPNASPVVEAAGQPENVVSSKAAPTASTGHSVADTAGGCIHKLAALETNGANEPLLDGEAVRWNTDSGSLRQLYLPPSHPPPVLSS